MMIIGFNKTETISKREKWAELFKCTLKRSTATIVLVVLFWFFINKMLAHVNESNVQQHEH